MRPTTTTVLRNATRGVSGVSASLAAASPYPLPRPLSWGVQGHHHQRYLSSSVHINSSLTKLSPFKPLRTTGWVSSSTLAVAGATTMIVGQLIWARSYGSSRNVAHCAESTTTQPKQANTNSAPSNKPRNPNDKDLFVSSKEISFGSMMGVCSGYLFKKLGKMFVLVAGLGYVTLQMLANAGYIQVNWMLIESRVNDNLDLDRDGKVTVKDAKYGMNWIIDLLTRNVQFKSTFAGGFYLGFRYG